MSFRRRLPTLGLSTAIALFAVSCGVSKTAQCNALVEEINNAGALASTFEAEINTELAGEMERLNNSAQGEPDFAAMATDVKSAADKLETKINDLVTTMTAGIGSVELSDETLVDLQSQHLALAESLGSKGTEMTGALQQMSLLLAEMDTLMADGADFTQEKVTALQTKAQELQTVATTIESSGTAFDELSTQEDEIIANINTYCGADS